MASSASSAPPPRAARHGLCSAGVSCHGVPLHYLIMALTVTVPNVSQPGLHAQAKQLHRVRWGGVGAGGGMPLSVGEGRGS